MRPWIWLSKTWPAPGALLRSKYPTTNHKEYMMRTTILTAAPAIALIGCADDRKPISAFEFQVLAEDCKAKGGVPTPIYDKSDPTKVYGLPCYAKP